MTEQDPTERPPQPPGSTPPPPPPSPPPTGQGYGGQGDSGQQQYGQQQYGGQPPGGYGPSGQLSAQDERTWGMLAHISAILAAIVFLSFLGPLIVLLVQGNKSPFVRKQAVEALNFQITTYIAAFVSAILVLVLIGFLLLVIVGIAWLVLTIMAGVAANRGEDYRYPVNLRLVK